MQTLVTGVSGYVGAALVPRLVRDGHAVRGFARSRERVRRRASSSTTSCSATRRPGAGLDRALDGVEVAYYLIHSMEGPAGGAFVDIERRQAEQFAERGGAPPACGGSSTSAAWCRTTARSRATSRRAWRSSEALLDAVPESIALRASIVVAARSRSFRFLVRLIERLPVLALPAWRANRTQPIDGRDVLEFLAARRHRCPRHAGRAWDIGGPDVMSYERACSSVSPTSMLIDRPAMRAAVQPDAGRLGRGRRGGRGGPGLIEPLMESLEHDLLPRDDDAAGAFGVRLHRFEAAVERALRDMEARGAHE